MSHGDPITLFGSVRYSKDFNVEGAGDERTVPRMVAATRSEAAVLFGPMRWVDEYTSITVVDERPYGARKITVHMSWVVKPEPE